MASTTMTSSSNALQETIEADIRTLPYFGNGQAISVDKENRVVVWSELDMTIGLSMFFASSQRGTYFRLWPNPFRANSPLRWVPKSVGRGKRVPCSGSHGHGVEVIMRTLTTDSQKALFPPEADGSRVRPIQRGSARWSCSAKRQAACHKRPFRTQFRESCAHLRAQVDVAET